MGIAFSLSISVYARQDYFIKSSHDTFVTYHRCCMILAVHCFIKQITSLSLFFLHFASHLHYAQDKHNFCSTTTSCIPNKADILQKDAKFSNTLRRRMTGECLK